MQKKGKLSCKLCEIGIRKSGDERLIHYKGWVKSADKFTISKDCCDKCLDTWSKSSGLPKEFYDQIPFWSNWHETILAKIKTKIKTDEEVQKFNEYWDMKKIHTRRLLKKMAGNPDKTVSIGKTFESYVNHMILGTPLVKHDVQEATKQDLAKIAKQAIVRLKVEHSIKK